MCDPSALFSCYNHGMWAPLIQRLCLYYSNPLVKNNVDKPILSIFHLSELHYNHVQRRNNAFTHSRIDCFGESDDWAARLIHHKIRPQQLPASISVTTHKLPAQLAQQPPWALQPMLALASADKTDANKIYIPQKRGATRYLGSFMTV